MPISYFLIANITVGILLLFLMGRFAWSMWFSTASEPPEWTRARKRREISGALIRLSRSYSDKIRFYTFWIQTDRLKREDIAGVFAEVGVYKGESARVLHLMDPDRDLHLFDTFQGFRTEDLKVEKGDAGTYTRHHFADTSEQSVINRIGGGNRVILHKGTFPETVSGLEHLQFALVNLDADLYRPTKSALDFFWPRLSPGGVVFIHDYNHRWEGIRKAVHEFSVTTGIVPVLIPDPDSTVILVKPHKETRKSPGDE